MQCRSALTRGSAKVVPLPNGTYVVHPTQTTTYTATATDQFNNQIQKTATVTVSTGGVSNLNHIIFMVQENRAFDNYFGQLATTGSTISRRYLERSLAM